MALFRYRVVLAVMQRFATTALAQAAAPSTAYEECLAAFAAIPELGEVPPPRNTFLRWWRVAMEAVAMDQRVEAALFHDKPRSGRPRHEICPWVAREAKKMWATGIYTSPTALHALLITRARRENLQPDVPGLDVLRRFLGELPALQVSAGRHGRRAAVQDNGLYSTIIAEFPHHVWTIDETKLPILVRAFDPTANQLVAIRPTLTILMDRYSRVVLGYHVTTPFLAPDGVGNRTGHDAISTDILGVVWAAAIPELATPSTREFSGSLPGQFRMDNAGSHGAVRALLETVGVDVPRLPAYTPQRRGDVESLIGTLKDAFPDTIGRPDLHFVAEAAEEHPGRTRSRNTEDRRSGRTPVALADLLPIDRVKLLVEEMIYLYHNRPHSGLGKGVTPRQAYFNALPPQPERRNGANLLLAAEPHNVTMRTEGIVVAKHRFRTVNPQEMPDNGAAVSVIVDPLYRGAFVIDGAKRKFVPRVLDAARAPEFTEHWSDVKREAAEASEWAQAERERHLGELAGDPQAAARGAAIMEATVKAKKAAKKKGARSGRPSKKTADTHPFEAEEDRVRARAKSLTPQPIISIPFFGGFKIGEL